MDLRMCRICGGIEDLKTFVDGDSEMVYKLLICANIKIRRGDILPKLICVRCEINLDISYRLRKQSEATQDRLRLQIENQRKILGILAKEANTLNKESISAYKGCEKLENNNENDLFGVNYKKQIEPNHFANWVEINKLEVNHNNSICALQTLQSSIVDTEEHQNVISSISVPDIENEEMSNVSDTHNNYFINISEGEEEDCQNTLNCRLVSEHYSIDLISSCGPSTNEYCNDLKNEQIQRELLDSNSFTCDTCHEVFTKKNEYSAHIKEHGVERYQCTQCCKFFPSRFRLKRHEEIHNDVPSYQCSYCNRNYRALYNLKRHIRSAHFGKKNWECSFCQISFSRIDVLKRHMQLHSEEKKFKCSTCSQSFKTKDYLWAHHKTHHTQTSECSKSNKRPRSKRNSGNKNQCGYCGKLFKSSFSYKNHLLIHTNEKPYKCESCKKHFRTIAALTTHQRIHDDYRPYQCDFCLKSFRQTAHLKEHRTLHLKNCAKHECSVCHASFSKKSNLKTHLRVHTKEKPFKCADCCAEFSYMHLLQRHANKVHCRSAHKVYTLKDLDEADRTDDNSCGNEIYHYIDTVADDDADEELGTNTANSVASISKNENMPHITPSKAQVVQHISFGNNSVAPTNETIVDYIQMNSSNSSDEEFADRSSGHRNHIKEQKDGILLTEETK